MTVDVLMRPNERLHGQNFNNEGNIDQEFELDLYDINSEIRILLYDVTGLTRSKLGQVVLPIHVLLKNLPPSMKDNSMTVKLLPLRTCYLPQKTHDGLFTPVYDGETKTGIKTTVEKTLGQMNISISIELTQPVWKLYLRTPLPSVVKTQKYDESLMKSSLGRLKYNISHPAIFHYLDKQNKEYGRLLFFPILIIILYSICFVYPLHYLPGILFCLALMNGILANMAEKERAKALKIWLIENTTKKKSTPMMVAMNKAKQKMERYFFNVSKICS
eukprot:UN25161